jgi:hypothetical protein
MSISGSAASDYQISPLVRTVDADETSVVGITFEPTSVGKRYATLMVTDDGGFSRSYTLVGEGLPRISWNGDIAEGGTATMQDGDTILQDKRVRRLMSDTFMPLMLENFSENVEADGAVINLTINDTSNQYFIEGPATATLLSGEQFVPQIRFDPKGVGHQPAELVVNADGEIRTFVLYAFSIAPGGRFFVDDVELSPSTGLFINNITCAGEVATTRTVTVRNVGEGPFVLTGLNAYKTDTTIKQGTPRYPLVFDGLNRPIPMEDYFFTRVPVTRPPLPNELVSYPDSIPEGQTRTYYITFLGKEPGKRFARAFVGTNGENFRGIDPVGDTVDGLLTFDLFGRAVGAELSDNDGKGLPKPMVFPSARVGDTIAMTYTFKNIGDCDLKIDLERLAIIEGDLDDFTLTEVFGRTVVKDGKLSGFAVLMPDSSATISALFHPQRSGSRRSTMFMATNDSSIVLPGLSNRGVYRFDIFGTGKTGLDYLPISFQPTLIGGTPGVSSVFVENTSVEGKQIEKIEIVGPDSTQFTEDAANPWPTLPKLILPGENLKIFVLFAPTGQPGFRNAILRLTLSDGQIIEIDLTGEAGTRTLVAVPSTLFDGAAVPTGKTRHETTVLTNTGTLPLTIQSVTVAGAGKDDYVVGDLPRRRIDPGGSEYLSVAFTPVNPGAPSTATMTIASDGGNVDVLLSGTAAGILQDDDATGTSPIGIRYGDGSDDNGVSGVAGSQALDGTQLLAARPNPAKSIADIGFRLTSRGDVQIDLFDATGRLVRHIGDGVYDAGEHHLNVTLGDLEAGVYHYRMRTAAGVLTQQLVVVR